MVWTSEIRHFEIAQFIRKCTLTLTLENMFLGSPEKLYFLSYDIFICRRRYAVMVRYLPAYSKLTSWPTSTSYGLHLASFCTRTQPLWPRTLISILNFVRCMWGLLSLCPWLCGEPRALRGVAGSRRISRHKKRTLFVDWHTLIESWMIYLSIPVKISVKYGLYKVPRHLKLRQY